MYKQKEKRLQPPDLFLFYILVLFVHTFLIIDNWMRTSPAFTELVTVFISTQDVLHNCVFLGLLSTIIYSIPWWDSNTHIIYLHIFSATKYWFVYNTINLIFPKCQRTFLLPRLDLNQYSMSQSHVSYPLDDEVIFIRDWKLILLIFGYDTLTQLYRYL